MRRKHQEPGNIAEGAGRGSKREFTQFLAIARGSLNELDTCVVIAKELGYLGDTMEIQALVNRVSGLIGGLINSGRRASST